MSVSNNIQVGKTNAAAVSGSTEQVASVSGAPQPTPTPEVLNNAANAVSPTATAAVNDAIDNAVDNEPPRVESDRAGKAAPADSATNNFRDLVYDKSKSMSEKMDALANAGVPAERREQRNDAMRLVLGIGLGETIANAYKSNGSYTGDGLNRMLEIQALHHVALKSMDALVEADTPEAIAKAEAECRQALQELADRFPGEADKADILMLADYLGKVSEAKQDVGIVLDEHEPALSKELDEAGDAKKSSAGNVVNFADFLEEADGRTRLEGTKTGQTGDIVLADSNRLDDKCRELGDMAALIEKRVKEGDADQLRGLPDDDAEFDQTFARAEDLIRRRVGSGEADRFAANAASLKEGKALLAADTVKADEHIAAMRSLFERRADGTFDDVDEMRTALDNAQNDKLFLTGEKRAELAAAAADLRLAMESRENAFEANVLPALKEKLAADLNAGIGEANRLIDEKKLPDHLTARVMSAVGEAMKEANARELAEINSLKAELGDMLKRHAADEATGEKGAKATAADRTKMAEKAQELSNRIDAALTRLEQTGVALGDAKTDGLDEALREARSGVEQIKKGELKDARDALSLMRFSQKASHRLSTGMVLNRGVPKVLKTLEKCTLSREQVDGLVSRLSEAPSASEAPSTLEPPPTRDDRKTLGRQLKLVLTGSQRENEPLKTAMRRLADPSKPLTQTDRDALMAASSFILSSEDAVEIGKEIGRVSKENKADFLARATKHMDGTKESLARLAAGGTDAADQRAMTNFGERLSDITAQAKLVLTPRDYRDLVRSIKSEKNAIADGMVSILREKSGAPELSKASSAFMSGLLKRSGFNTKAAELVLQSGKVDELQRSFSAEADPARKTELLNEIFLDHPDLDDVALSAAKLQYSKRGFSTVQSPDARRQAEQRHECDRLVRSCKTQLGDAVILNPEARRNREALLALPNDQFLDRLKDGLGMAGTFDVFAVRALWLQHASQLEGPLPDDAFAEFQATLPEPYCTRASLEAEITAGVASTETIDECQDLVGDMASSFDRSRLGHRALDFVGNLFGKEFTRAGLMDNLLMRMTSPKHHAEADIVKNNILAEARGVQTRGSIAADAANIAAILPNGSDADLSAKEKGLRLLHLRSQDANFNDLADQVNRVATRSNPDMPFVTAEEAGAEVNRLHHSHSHHLSNVLGEVRIGTPGKFKNGVNMSLRTLAIDQALQTGGWELKKRNLNSIKDLDSHVNILSMEQSVLTKKGDHDSKAAKAATAEFRTALGAMKAAENEADFLKAETDMRNLMARHSLVERAKAVLVYAPANKGDLDRRLDGIIDGKACTPAFRSSVDAAAGPLYQAMAGAMSLKENVDKAGDSARTHGVNYYMSGAVSSAFREAATVALLDQFANAHPPVGFGDFVDSFASEDPKSGFPRALAVMTEAVENAAPGRVPRANAEKVATIFLKEAAKSYKVGEGGAEACLERQAQDVRDPNNLRLLDKKFKDDRDSALAIRDGLRGLQIDSLLDNMSHNSMTSLDTSMGAEVTYEEFSLSGALKEGIAIARDRGDGYSVVISSGVAVGLGVEFSALGDTFSASASLEGTYTRGFRIDFADKEKCQAFVGGLLSGKGADPVAMGGKLSTITEMSLAFEAEASLGIGGKVDELTPKIQAAQALIDDEKSRVPDHRRIVDLELSAKLSASLAKGKDVKDQVTTETHKLNFSASVEAKARIGQDGGVLDKEGKLGVDFAAELKTSYSSGKLVGGTMTRVFDIDAKSTEEDVRKLLGQYGVENEGLVSFVMEKLGTGMPLSLSVDARLTAAGLAKYQEIGEDDALALGKRAMVLCDRDNYTTNRVRVTQTTNGTSMARAATLKEAAESEDEADDDDDSTGGVLGSVQQRVDSVKDAIGEQVDRVAEPVRQRVNQALDAIPNETVRSGARDALGLGDSDDLAGENPGFFDKVGIEVTATASGNAVRMWPFAVLPSA